MIQASGRRTDLNIIRVLAFALIIVYHFILEMSSKSIIGAGIPYAGPNMHMATLGVGLFFMISGAGLMLSTKPAGPAGKAAGEAKAQSAGIKAAGKPAGQPDWKAYYLKRFVRIMIPFYLAYLGCLLIMLLMRHPLPFDGSTPPWTAILTVLGVDEYFSLWGVADFTLGIGEWFLGCLIIIYLVYPLLWNLMKKHRYIFMGCATVYYILLLVFYPFGVPAINNVLAKVYEFILGMFVMEEWRSRGLDGSRRLWMVSLVSLAVILIFLLCPFSIPLPEDLKVTILVLAVLLFFMSLERLWKKSGRLEKILSVICRYSFEIYLVHHMIIYQFALWLEGRALSPLMVMLVFLAELAVMVLAGLVLKLLSALVLRLFRHVLGRGAHKEGRSA